MNIKHLVAIMSLVLLNIWHQQAFAVDAVKLEGKIFQGSPTGQITEPVQLRLHPDNLPVRAARGMASATDIVLPPLTAAEQQLLQQPHESGERAFRIGIGRVLPKGFTPATDWDWRAVAGGYVAHLGVTSTEAERIRVQLQAKQLPAGVELRFYAPQDPETVYGPYTWQTLQLQLDDNAHFWSPSIDGETLQIEVFVPEDVPQEKLDLQVIRVSHVVLDMLSGKLQPKTLEKASVDCHIDMACATPEWQSKARSTALLLFADDEGEYTCTGELLNSSGNGWTPYFLQQFPPSLKLLYNQSL